MSNGFDRLARPYRWMEYLTFGRALQRCRCQCLPNLGETRHALVLGDGDGRFTARLLARAPHANVHAVDASPAMLRALRRRCKTAGTEDRVTTHLADLSRRLPQALQDCRFDLVATHFFLDCLTTAEVESLADRVKPLLSLDARWILSEFNIPASGFRLPARLLVRLLYLGFRLLTGLRTQQLPDYRAALLRTGFERLQTVQTLGGVLVSEVWVVRRQNWSPES